MRDEVRLAISIILKELIMKKSLIIVLICLFAGCATTQDTQKRDNGRHDKGSSHREQNQGHDHNMR